MKYEAVKVRSPEFSVRKMCEVKGLCAENYYRWLRRRKKMEVREEEERKMAEIIRREFLENKWLYGYRRMRRNLERKGIRLSEYKIRALMRKNGLYPLSQRRYRPGRSLSIRGLYAADELKQDFTTERPGQVVTGDITYIRTNRGWVYLAIVMDLYNLEVIGYSISQSMDSELVRNAMGNALAKTGGLRGAVFHSDRGCQYNSESYKRMLRENGITQSMSRAGCPYDNACSESFFATAKRECLYLRKYATIDEVKKDIFEYVELFYNRKRMHSYLGYMSPVEYRLAHSG